jgi:CheY-like chemotaxis protein
MAHKLLLADDSVTIQRVIELTFADEPIEVITVGDGAEAIARIEAERPDVVLADAGMPEKDGYEVAAYVKRHEHLKHIPVLLLTGAFEPVDEARARAAGCDGVLVKPFEPQVVIARVKDLLAGRRPAGLWLTPPPTPARPAPEAPTVTGRVDYKAFAEPAAVAEPAAAEPAESLDEYFDRLDAAFASLGLEEPAGASAAPEPAAETALHPEGVPPERPRAPSEPAESFAAAVDRWDPSLGAEAEAPRVAPVVAPPGDTSAAGGARGDAAAPPPTRTAAGRDVPAATPSLSEAFAALLAAEQAQAAAVPAPSAPAAVSEELVEAVVARVIERMTSQAVRETVLEVAERLVREEIARIKSAAR